MSARITTTTRAIAFDVVVLPGLGSANAAAAEHPRPTRSMRAEQKQPDSEPKGHHYLWPSPVGTASPARAT
ncbi:hypothetical protein [Occultella gossypii]|uniref:Secreted protein n=1 Tax=Occultella gossypii TaxID=2800820 RepID=A0ABS7S6U2_9MICO|nr:hypothetical protein [Occultella gossypii]MBZ2195339.1 hypothetical protein [Occultella gossypii]